LELSWSTFVLEIINFLVLVWILERFLYKPVLEVIARRRAVIENSLADAAALRTEAERLQTQYEGRLADWEQERQQAREALARDLEAERARKLVELQSVLEQEREKVQVAEARRQADALGKTEEAALMQGARFATRLLERASGPAMETRLVELVLTELAQLPTERVTALRNSYGKTPDAILVISAFPLADEQRERLKQALVKVTSLNIPFRFEQDRELLAGVRLIIGAWVLAANLRDELKGFVELAHGEYIRYDNQPA
jgi:F-type H+-transporting ATPase subunit b